MYPASVSPLLKPGIRSAIVAGGSVGRKPMTGIGCCGRNALGQVAAA